MKSIMLIQPWNYHDENLSNQDLSKQWRNGPYNIVSLASYLKVNNVSVKIVDLQPICVYNNGNVQSCLSYLTSQIKEFKPDIIGVSFFSYQVVEAEIIARHCRQTSINAGISPTLIAGGIHASIEPLQCIEQMGFDYSFVGEGEEALLSICMGEKPENIQGMTQNGIIPDLKGRFIKDLDSLPFVDWDLCDYPFYTHPSSGKISGRTAKTLDVLMGHGCVNRCAFCAYSSMSTLRFHSPEYIVEQINEMHKRYDIDSVYFIDSSIGNNQKLLIRLCELLIASGYPNKFEWYANIRSNQVDESILLLMRESGCHSLFYGFESGSQRILDAMNKQCTIEQNIAAAELHNKLGFPYHASMILGFPGETEEDIAQSVAFLKQCRPPRIGINCYVPLPGCDNYEQLRSKGILNTKDIWQWRLLGEVLTTGKVYASVEESRFRELFKNVCNISASIAVPNIEEWIRKRLFIV